MKPETNNFIWAMVLSVMVLFAWQYFFAKPQLERQRQAQVEAQHREPNAHGEAARRAAPATRRSPTARACRSTRRRCRARSR